MGNARKGRKRTKSKSSPTNKESAPSKKAKDMATNNQQSQFDSAQQQIGQNAQNSQGVYQQSQGFCGLQASQNGAMNMNMNHFSPTQQQLYASPSLPYTCTQNSNMGSPNVGHNVQPLPLPVIPNTNTVSSDQFAYLCQRLDSIDSKLARLDTIESTVNKITGRLDKLDQKANRLDTKISDIEKSREYDSKMLDEINKKQKDIDSMMEKIKRLEKEQTEKDREMKADIVDMKSRSMRDNLLFFGIDEERGEKDSDCIDKVLNIIENKLGIENAKSDMKIHRAHRIGKYNENKTRPIVTKFAFYQDRERVRQNAKKLDRPLGISQQFPIEVMERRRKLVPVMLDARRQGKDARLVVDKLYIDGQLHRDDTSAAGH